MRKTVGSPVTIPQSRIQRSALSRSLITLYLIEAMVTVGGTLMSVGIFFYMKFRFGWGMPQNFMLAAAQGLVYVPAALLAGRVTGLFGQRRALIGIYTVLAALTVVACTTAASGRAGSAGMVVAALLSYTFLIGLTWPVLESLVATGGPATAMARRVSLYNVIWPAGGAAAIAIEGTILQHWIAGLFLIPGILHVCSVIALLLWREPPEAATAPAHVEPEPELLRKRKLALWLSRTALPATYTVIYGLMPMMPSLPAMKNLPTSLQTVVGAVWLMTRWLAFLILALGSWWHTRPRVLLWAAVTMLVAFFGMTLRPTAGASPTTDLVSLIAWQALLGLAIGMIYAGSLYFGMVLSKGSTEHGGYHEALIGLGWVLGPAAGAGAQAVSPGNLWLGIVTVGGVITASVAAVMVTAVVLGRSSREAVPTSQGTPNRRIRPSDPTT
jgi:MFS family permease